MPDQIIDRLRAAQDRIIGEFGVTAVTDAVCREIQPVIDDLCAAPEHPPKDIHLWFELTYANYLVAPRSVLQSMPEEWQHRFTGLLDEMHEEFGYLDWPAYSVQALKRATQLIQVREACGHCGGDATVKDDDGDEIDCPECDGSGERQDDVDHRYETPEEVGYRPDPIPHYNRGRTRLERASEKAEVRS